MFEVREADPMVFGIVASDPHGDGGWPLAGTDDGGSAPYSPVRPSFGWDGTGRQDPVRLRVRTGRVRP